MASRFPGAERREVIDGVEVVRTGGLLWLWLTTFLFYMRQARGRYDVVVTEGFGGSRIPRLTPLYVREPIITEWHQIHSDLFAAQYPAFAVPFLNLLERLTAFVHRDTILMARTQDWKKAFPRLGFKADNIHVVPACIDDSWFRDGRPTAVSRERFAWIGKFRRYKCPDHAIRALKVLQQSVPTASLVLAGFHDDRKYEAELARLVDSLGLRESVAFHFDVSEDEKRALLDSCGALLLPSSVEGFGIVVLEANARGVPVIASTGVPEGAVQDEVNGLRYPFGRPDELAHSMARIALDDELYHRLSTNANEFAHQFRWSDVCRQYADIVSSAAQRIR